MPSKAPRVAVLTPVYNGAEFLREAMASVQAQTCPNLVHFVLDNASTDATSEIIREFQGRRVPVIVVRNDTLLPLGQNWNKCVALGSRDTDYFRILCADDTMPPDSAEKMVALAETDPAITLVACNRQGSDGVEGFGWPEQQRVFDGRDAIRACFLGETAFAPTHFLYRSSVVSLRKPFFDDSILAFDTEVAYFILLQEGARFGFVHEPLGFTRRHAGSVTHTTLSVMHNEYFDWLVILSRYGRRALTLAEFEKRRQLFRRHYFGRLLVWRLRHGNTKAFDWHLAALNGIGQKPGTIEFLDAIGDYALRKLSLRPTWNRYPQG